MVLVVELDALDQVRLLRVLVGHVVENARTLICQVNTLVHLAIVIITVILVVKACVHILVLHVPLLIAIIHVMKVLVLICVIKYVLVG